MQELLHYAELDFCKISIHFCHAVFKIPIFDRQVLEFSKIGVPYSNQLNFKAILEKFEKNGVSELNWHPVLWPMNKKCTIYSDRQKKMHPPVFQTLVFPVYLRNLLRYKIYWYLFVSLSEKKKNIFSNTVNKSADITKSQLLRKIRHFEKFKNFFPCKARNRIYKQTRF